MTWYEYLMKSPWMGSGDRIGLLELLYPPVHVLLRHHLNMAEEADLNVRVTETYRSPSRQAKLYLDGKSKIQSLGTHTFGLAYDLVVCDAQGQPLWHDKEKWQLLGLIGKSLGLHWGGDWKGLVDCPHFQYISVSEQANLRAGKMPLIYGGNK